MGAWTAGQAPWYLDFKNRYHPHMLGVVLSVLRAAGRADWKRFSGSSWQGQFPLLEPGPEGLDSGANPLGDWPAV